MCPGINQLFYLGNDIKDGIARSSLLPDHNKNGCLSHLIAPAYDKLKEIVYLLIETSIVVLPSFIFAFPSCTPYDRTEKGKLFRLEEIDETVIEEEVR